MESNTVAQAIWYGARRDRTRYCNIMLRSGGILNIAQRCQLPLSKQDNCIDDERRQEEAHINKRMIRLLVADPIFGWSVVSMFDMQCRLRMSADSSPSEIQCPNSGLKCHCLIYRLSWWHLRTHGVRHRYIRQSYQSWRLRLPKQYCAILSQWVFGID